MVEDPSFSDARERKRIEDMFDATFGALIAIAAELGFSVEFGEDGLWHASARELSSASAGVTEHATIRTTPVSR